LFIEGARWDNDTMVLGESRPKILFDIMPIILLKPGEYSKFVKKSTYTCPIYKTSARRGTLSTTGHSTNFVLFIDVPSSKPQSHWINRGKNLFCLFEILLKYEMMSCFRGIQVLLVFANWMIKWNISHKLNYNSTIRKFWFYLILAERRRQGEMKVALISTFYLFYVFDIYWFFLIDS